MNDSLTLSLEPREGEMAVEQIGGASPAGDMDVTSNLRNELPVENDEGPVHVTWKRESRQRNILFVDDDQRFLDLCKRRFETSDYTIFTANGAKAALALLSDHKVDVVISDMRMPEVSGAELLHEVERKYPDTIRIIISGKFDQADTIDAINKGHIYKYLTKPFNDRDLKLTIYQALLEKERREADAQRIKDRQENARRRAKQLGEVVAQCRSKMDSAYDECVWMLAKLVATHDDTNVRAATVAERLAESVNLEEAECRQIKVAALLQDLSTIGKPALPSSSMSSTEQKAWFRHPLMSAKLLSELGPFKQAAFIVKSHHERFDGKGFPGGLKGEEIPMGARIVALSTSYARARRGCALSHESAMETLTATPSRFDPELLELLAGLDLEQLLLI